MNSEHFIRFVKYFNVFVKAPQITIVKAFDKNFWLNYVNGAIAKSKVFEIDEDLKRLLLLSNPPIDNEDLHLPFDYIFLDVSFLKDELAQAGFDVETEEIIGVMVSKGNIYKSKKGDLDLKEQGLKSPKDVYQNSEIVGTDLRITICAILKGEIQFETMIKNKKFNKEDDYKEVEIEDYSVLSKQVKNVVHRFFLNFLNFLNNPEVEYVEHKRSEKNQQRRMKQGKPIIPSSFTIKVDGKLKQYIDEVRTHMANWTYNYRFWVRGFFRQLKDKKYTDKKRFWIFPYIKGKGLLIEKHYKLIKK